MLQCFTVLLIVAASLNFVQPGQVLVQPKSQVTFQGTTVSFFCEGTGFNAIVEINEVLRVGGGIFVRDKQLEAEYLGRNVSWVKTVESGNHIRWAVHVYASPINNNTKVQCFFGEKISVKAIVVIVEGPPEPPGTPTLTVTNLTTLTLTWSAPWQHPISNYTVTVTNTSSGLVRQFTVYEEQFVLRNEGGAGGGCGGVYCDELVFTVEAETDVGRSGTSLNATGNFPRSIGSVNETELSVQMNLFVQDRSAALNVQFQPPLVCSYQNLTYVFEIFDVNRTILVLRESSPLTYVTLIGGILFNHQYTLQITIQNNEWENVTLMRNFTFVGQCPLQISESKLPGNCSSISSNAQTHFRKAFNLSSCALFGELNFSGITGSLWSHIADECITESTNIRNLLRQVSENRPQLTHSHCQSHLFTNTENVCQCSMDCLLTFLLSENSTIQSGYIHLRNISCNQSLFIAAITDLFNKTHNATSFITRSKKCLEAPFPSTTASIYEVLPPSMTILPTPENTPSAPQFAAVIIVAGSVVGGVATLTSLLLVLVIICSCVNWRTRKFKTREFKTHGTSVALESYYKRNVYKMKSGSAT